MAIKHFLIDAWNDPITPKVQEEAIEFLEKGYVLYFPSLNFPLHENEFSFLSPGISDPKSKNVSYDTRQDKIKGAICSEKKTHELKNMIKRFSETSCGFLEKLIPSYTSHLIKAKTSYRPVEIRGRKSSYRKDDTLLHVDSFPSSPTNGQRILRLFTNINPEGKARVWKLGEPFEDVVEKMLPGTSSPIWGMASLYQMLRVTKGYRTEYDHYMLKIHNKMKGDAHYQKTVPQLEVRFPPGSTWIVFTDQVSHAALEGQYVLEQTFHLPIEGMKNRATAPLKVLEKRLNKTLV